MVCLAVAERPPAKLTVSIVSHGHGGMVEDLLQDLASCPEAVRIVLTLNVPEADIRVPAGMAERVVLLRNPAPKGFGANHNAAFRHCATPYFCVLNPDVRLQGNPFPVLLAALGDGVALSAPLVLSPAGEVEDSARHFPTVRRLFAKLMGWNDGRHRQETADEAFRPDWLAGMFMVFASDAFAALKGFDEGYFLYYEDVDICTRLWRSRRSLVVCPQASVVHAAQRASRRNLRYMRWHLASMGRYFLRHWGRLPYTRSVP